MGGDTGKGKIEGITKFAEVMTRLKLVLDGTGLSIDGASTEMIRTLKVFGKGTDKILNFASALTAMDNSSTADAGELLEMMSRLSGVGKTIGATIPDLLALSPTMRDAGVDVDSGSTAVSQLRMRMSGDVGKFADAVQLDVKRFRETVSKDPVKVVELWLNALKRFDSGSQTNILKGQHMQGRMSGQLLLKLANGMGGSLDKNRGVASSDWGSM